MNERSAWFWCRLALLVGATAFTLLWIAGLLFGRQNMKDQPLSVWGPHGERLLVATTGRESEPFQFLALVTEKGTVVQRPPVFPGEFTGTLTEAAFLAAEDRNFFQHSGWSLTNLLLAIVTGGHRGASTITQQYVRSQWGDFRHSAGRKWREMMVALAVESRLNKQAVLAGYWNTAYFGLDRDGKAVYGLTDASYRLLGKPPQALRPSEAALLAGILRRANTATAEWRAGDSSRLAETRNSILRLMHKHWSDSFSDESLTIAISETVPRMARPASPNVHDDDCSRYFVDYARKEAQSFPPGSTILTTIDLPLQEEMCRLLKEEGQEIESRIRPELSRQAGRLEFGQFTI
jgi:membrane peptidoglycan carboxypeptidase